MTGSIQIKKQRANYYAVLNIYDELGKRKLKWIDTGIPVKGNNKRKANEKLNELLASYNETKIDLTKDILFTDFIARWLENLQRNIQPTTYDAYRLTLDKHILPYFQPMKLKVRDIEPMHIQQYVNSKLKTLSPNTVKRHMANISKCFDSAVKQNMIAFNPAKRIDTISKVKYTGAKFYNEKQIEQLFSCSKNDPLEIAILITVFYGLRRSEILGLRWNAVDFDNNTIAIRHTVVKVTNTVYRKNSTKNDASYAVLPLPNLIKTELLKWKAKQAEHARMQPKDYDNQGYICTQIDGSLIKPDYVSQHFNLLLRKHSMPVIRFHDLRHSAASYLLYLGFNLKEIQTWLRHADIQTSMNLYTHLDMTAKTEIANSLNERFANLGRLNEC